MTNIELMIEETKDQLSRYRMLRSSCETCIEKETIKAAEYVLNILEQMIPLLKRWHTLLLISGVNTKGTIRQDIEHILKCLQEEVDYAE